MGFGIHLFERTAEVVEHSHQFDDLGWEVLELRVFCTLRLAFALALGLWSLGGGLVVIRRRCLRDLFNGRGGQLHGSAGHRWW